MSVLSVLSVLSAFEFDDGDQCNRCVTAQNPSPSWPVRAARRAAGAKNCLTWEDPWDFVEEGRGTPFVSHLLPERERELGELGHWC